MTGETSGSDQAVGPVLPAGSRIELADGRSIAVRPIRPDDAVRLRCFHDHLSRRTIYLRFFGSVPHLSDALARRFAEVDGVNRYAIVALDPDDPDALIGVAHFDRGPAPDEGELAIVLMDRFQGTGLGRQLLGRLVEAARERGIRRLCAVVLAENARMIRLLRHLGYPHHETFEAGTERVWLVLDGASGA